MTPEKKKKIRKIIIITSISVVSFYILGGVVASFIVNDVVFKDKVTNNGVLQSSVAFYKTQKDYPLLSERQEHTFKSGKNKLSGYYYDVSEDKGLVIFAHGLSNYSDDCNAQMHNYFVELGYDVFAIDLTGSGKSTGRTTIGLHQSAYDIKSAYNYLKDNNLLKDNLILCGHSWGAYGSVIASSIGVKTDKVIAFSGYNCPIDMMHEIAKQQVGFLADLNYPTYALPSPGGDNNSSSIASSLIIKVYGSLKGNSMLSIIIKSIHTLVSLLIYVIGYTSVRELIATTSL